MRSIDTAALPLLLIGVILTFPFTAEAAGPETWVARARMGDQAGPLPLPARGPFGYAPEAGIVTNLQRVRFAFPGDESGRSLILSFEAYDIDEDGARFGPARALASDGVPLFAGTYPCPVVLDWDNDGLEDLLVANYAGEFLLFRGKKGAGGLKAPPKREEPEVVRIKLDKRVMKRFGM